MVATVGRSRIFQITAWSSETFSQLVRDGRYDHVHGQIDERHFPVSPPGSTTTRKIVLLQFRHDIDSRRPIAEAANQGLERPTFEDCLRFGAQHPEVQRQFPLAFLHRPVQGYGFPAVLHLTHLGSKRELDIAWFDGRWDYRHRFAFVDPT